jgi:hypothetical protein
MGMQEILLRKEKEGRRQWGEKGKKMNMDEKREEK